MSLGKSNSEDSIYGRCLTGSNYELLDVLSFLIWKLLHAVNPTGNSLDRLLGCSENLNLVNLACDEVLNPTENTLDRLKL